MPTELSIPLIDRELTDRLERIETLLEYVLVPLAVILVILISPLVLRFPPETVFVAVLLGVFVAALFRRTASVDVFTRS
ncbi:hypothetical protein [Natrononativus amylolyticus]|uniref:hypothetical protein n=1 Tax=Natrononativus amylolyticus TaxID=2963434 RepID=UPI0020CE7A9E|nr:hypothetical protein [Natrononativus amylolyticus]